MKGTIMLRPAGIASMVALAAFVTGTGNVIQSCQPAPQPSHTGAIVGAVAIVGGVVLASVILVSVEKDHHNIKGCVVTSQSGLELRDDKAKQTYTLLGATAGTKPGDIVRLHGVKEKGSKGSAGDPSFVVEKVMRTYGSCSVTPTPVTTAANVPLAANQP
jgi:hypothetical protein